MLESLLEIVKLFDENKIQYCLIGGLAMMLHHGRANTVDMDFYVLVTNLKKIEKIFNKKNITYRTAGEYQLKAKLNDVPIDILFADEYVGSDVVIRSIPKKLGNHIVQVATVEDIIVLKTIANRSVDKRDIEELRELYKKSIDEDYVTNKLKKVNDMLAE